MRTVKLTQIDCWRQMPPAGAMRAWLTDRGSLTAKIVAQHNNFNLVKLAQHLAPPFKDERRALGLKCGELAVIREVLLRDGNTNLVFAHTAANPRDLRGAWRGLSRLGNRPLAEMLFRDARVSRMALEYKQLPPSHPLVKAVQRWYPEAALSPTPLLWARRSVFLKNNRPLMVTEVFLCALMSR